MGKAKIKFVEMISVQQFVARLKEADENDPRIAEAISAHAQYPEDLYVEILHWDNGTKEYEYKRMVE